MAESIDDYKVAICMTTHDRPDYLDTTLKHLVRSLYGNEKIVISDNNSLAKEVFKILDFYLKDFPDKHILRHADISVAPSLRMAIDMCDDCDVIISIDSDILVRKDYIPRMVNAVMNNPNRIITGINATSHPSDGKYKEFLTKKTISGMNIAFTWKTYLRHIKHTLVDNMWDWKMCDSINKAADRFLCFSPSICQHIGDISTIGHSKVDKAADFVMDEEEPKIKLTRQEFMDAFRDEDFYNTLTVDDCRELFISSLKGSDDITISLLNELLNNYGITNIKINNHE